MVTPRLGGGLSKPSSPSLLDILNPDYFFGIYDHWCSLAPLKSILALSQTCKQMHRAFQQRWNVDSRLQRFVKNPSQLRSQLGKHGSLISGSFAIQFFKQQLWKDSDLDIFVEQGEAVTGFDRYLQQDEDYRLESTNDPHGKYAMRGLIQVRPMSERRIYWILNEIRFGHIAWTRHAKSR